MTHEKLPHQLSSVGILLVTSACLLDTHIQQDIYPHFVKVGDVSQDILDKLGHAGGESDSIWGLRWFVLLLKGPHEYSEYLFPQNFSRKKKNEAIT